MIYILFLNCYKISEAAGKIWNGSFFKTANFLPKKLPSEIIFKLPHHNNCRLLWSANGVLEPPGRLTRKRDKRHHKITFDLWRTNGSGRICRWFRKLIGQQIFYYLNSISKFEKHETNNLMSFVHFCIFVPAWQFYQSTLMRLLYWNGYSCNFYFH